jgi:uncharacterized protein (TIGR02145 family)
MKNLITFMVLLFLVSSLKAQDTMYIHETGNILLKVPVNNIDSVIFYASNGGTPPGTCGTGNSVKDIDGNCYSTVTIDTQTWMQENLRVTHFNDGTPIPLVTSASTWSSTSSAAYAWFADDTAESYKNGVLYNGWVVWYSILNSDVCPTGWHIPTESEWNTLFAAVGNGILQSSGFAAVISGSTDGNGAGLATGGSANNTLWWTSTGAGGSYSELWGWQLNAGSTSVTSAGYTPLPHGFSIRCKK